MILLQRGATSSIRVYRRASEGIDRASELANSQTHQENLNIHPAATPANSCFSPAFLPCYRNTGFPKEIDPRRVYPLRPRSSFFVPFLLYQHPTLQLTNGSTSNRAFPNSETCRVGYWSRIGKRSSFTRQIHIDHFAGRTTFRHRQLQLHTFHLDKNRRGPLSTRRQVGVQVSSALKRVVDGCRWFFFHSSPQNLTDVRYSRRS